MASDAFLLLASYLAVLLILAQPPGHLLSVLILDCPLRGVATVETALWRICVFIWAIYGKSGRLARPGRSISLRKMEWAIGLSGKKALSDHVCRLRQKGPEMQINICYAFKRGGYPSDFF